MVPSLNQLLSDAIARKRCKCTVETMYSHENLHSWLQSALVDWDIYIPQQKITGSYQ